MAPPMALNNSNDNGGGGSGGEGEGEGDSDVDNGGGTGGRLEVAAEEGSGCDEEFDDVMSWVSTMNRSVEDLDA